MCIWSHFLAKRKLSYGIAPEQLWKSSQDWNYKRSTKMWFISCCLSLSPHNKVSNLFTVYDLPIMSPTVVLFFFFYETLIYRISLHLGQTLSKLECETEEDMEDWLDSNLLILDCFGCCHSCCSHRNHIWLCELGYLKQGLCVHQWIISCISGIIHSCYGPADCDAGEL